MAAKYRNLAWKRNLKKIPDVVRQAVEGLSVDLFFVGVTKTIAPEEVAEEYNHLSIPLGVDERTKTLPPRDVGPYSAKNLDGWEVVRRDLPKITKTYFWETPNFGDASTYGTHTHYQDREVYQREFYEPRHYKISVQTLQRTPVGALVCHFRVEQSLNRKDADLQSELLFCLNLLQENCGLVGVTASEATVDDYLRTINLDWEVFPPGTADEVIERMIRGRATSAPARQKMAERIALFSKLKPEVYLRGSGGFGSYIGAQYADNLVVFENLQYGNALYMLYDNWKDVSKRSRLQLLRGTDDRFDRIPHTIGWEEAFEKILRREKRKRGLR